MEEVSDIGSPRLASFICFDAARPYRHQERGTDSVLRRRSVPPVSTKSPSRLPVKPSKRKQEHPCYEPIYVESCLVQLCRGRKWSEVIRRCKLHPGEANPVPLSTGGVGNEIDENFHKHYTNRAVKNPIEKEQEIIPIYRETALGIVCASKDLDTQEMISLVQILTESNPHQVGASQIFAGHTALRDAILNDHCPAEVLRILFEASSRCADGYCAYGLKDRNGLSVYDHLVLAIQLRSSYNSLDKMKAYIENQPFRYRTSGNTISPLIRLLTMGNSFGATVPGSDKSHRPAHEDIQTLERILEVTKFLLNDDPSLLYQSSRLTGCTPLHVAIRNYGNYEPFIQELLVRDVSCSTLKCQNLYGDLPIHVACSVGVPLHVLRLLVERTVQVSCLVNSSDPGMSSCLSRDPLIWSANKSGYTPVDLEWVRHIESGDGFYTARTFYPLEPNGVRRHCFKQDEYYKELLREAVEHVMQSSVSGDDGSNSKAQTKQLEARSIFGSLMDRISLLIRAAATPQNLSRPADLADACKLCVPYGPVLPVPILELFLWLHSGEIAKKDEHGMLPLHYALSDGRALGKIQCQPNIANDWQAFVFRLLDTHPEQCKAQDASGRLPLHLVLDHSDCSDAQDPLFSQRVQASRHAVVEKLIEMYPESVDARDPVSGLHPFMMGTVDQHLLLDTIFRLLRRSPSRCSDALSVRQ